MSINYNSIGKNPKRSVFFQKMAKLQPDILFAIDTRLDPSLDNEIKEEWGVKHFFHHSQAIAGGWQFLLKKNSQFQY